MFQAEAEKEPDEYKRLVWLLAVNEQVLTELTEQYDSGTDAPPAKLLSSPLLPKDDSIVPPTIITEYRQMLLRHSEKLRGDINQFKRIRVPTHDLSEAPHAPGPRSKAQPAAKKTTRISTKKTR